VFAGILGPRPVRVKVGAPALRCAVRALLLLGVLVATGFVGLMLHGTEGHFVAQSPDLYVVCQYARAMAEGRPFQYNAGEAPTTGATSVLHTTILAIGHAAGARGEGLVAFAVLLGAALYLASIALAGRVGTLLAGPREGRLAGALVALGGPVVWSFLYGSDIALFLFLALLVFERFLVFWREGRPGGLAVAGAALALARPEGLIVAAVLGAASVFRPGPASTRQRALPFVPLLAALALVLLVRTLTGTWFGTSVSDKSLLPNYGLVQTVDVVTKYGVDVLRGLLLGFYPAESPVGFSPGQAPFAFPPLGLLLVLLAAVRPRTELRVPVRVWLVLVAIVVALAGTNMFMGVQFNRYALWALPGLLALLAAGLGLLSRLLAREDDQLERSLFRAGAGLFLVLGLLSTAHFAAIYGEMAAATWRREIPAARWIREHLPPGTGIANAATSIEYLTGHRNTNLHGVTSPAFVGIRPIEKEAGTYEALCRIPATERPPYILLTRGGLDQSALLPLLLEGAARYETSSLGDDLLLFRARWDLLDRGIRPHLPETLAAVAGLELVDRLNVSDVEDEAAHGYRLESRAGELVLGGFVRIDDYHLASGDLTVADAGRAILGSESFRVRTRAGRPLVVVVRSHPELEVRALRSQGGLVAQLEMPVSGLRVEAGEKTLLRVELPNHPGWNEHVLRLSGEALSDGTTTLRLSGRYAAFHYWFYQPR